MVAFSTSGVTRRNKIPTARSSECGSMETLFLVERVSFYL